MIKNYFKIAFRNLLRHKLLSGINILGLATGIACCLVIALYVFHEKRYDRFHKNADRIVRATMELYNDGNVVKVAVTGTKVLPEFKRVFPEVESGVRLYPVTAIVKQKNNIFQEKKFIYADSTFLNIFSFPLLQGDPQRALDKPNQLIITESAAKKYFGTENAIGKTLQVNNKADYVVTAVARDVPANSQIQFNMVASWSSLTDPVFQTESWSDASHYTYLLLRKPGMHTVLESTRIAAYFKAQNQDYGVAGKSYRTIHVQPLTEVHLNAITEGGLEPAGDYRYVYIFSFVALLILVIACANYVNLTTARAVERAKEVGIRKVAGASQRQLFTQFIAESALSVFVALLISLIIVRIVLFEFNSLLAKQFSIESLLSPAPLIALAILLFTVGFLGSMYPAMVLSRFNPVKVFKGNIRTNSSGIGLRKSLIVVQFFISVLLIISTIVIQSQLSFIRNKKLGYSNDHVLELRSDELLLQKISTVKSELMAKPGILGVTTCNQNPTFVPGKYNMVLNDKELIIGGIRVDKDFISTMGIKIRSGSDFTAAEEKAAFEVTDTIQRPVMINEAAVRSFGWTKENAVGKTFSFQGRNSIVKAVIADFHYTSMHEFINPFIVFLSNRTSRVLIKLSGNEIPGTLRSIEKIWAELAPHLPFEYEFLDDQYSKLYNAETKTGKLFYVFALLAIGLACLGLFGLSIFIAEQRTKEIGIRKVLGANVISIVQLLSKDFMKLVAIAFIIATPIAWYLMNKWLQDFVYRINIGSWIFLLAGVLAVAIALITISFQAIRAATVNPVKSLRSE